MKPETRIRIIRESDGAKIDADILAELCDDIAGGDTSNIDDAIRLAKQARDHVNSTLRALQSVAQGKG